jgi:hypothetical protein
MYYYQDISVFIDIIVIFVLIINIHISNVQKFIQIFVTFIAAFASSPHYYYVIYMIAVKIDLHQH